VTEAERETRGIAIEGLALTRLRDLAELTATVGAAATVGIFRGLREEPAAAEELARRLDLDGRAVAILLPVLEEAALLHRLRDGRYTVTPSARRHLADPDAEEYEGGGLPLWLENLRAFTRLPEVLREGGPLERAVGADAAGDEAGADEEALARFMAAMAAAPRARIERLVDRCVERLGARTTTSGPPRVLDLGGGPGHMSRVFTEKGFRAVLFDKPETVRYVGDAYGLDGEAEIDLVGGDFVEDPLPQGPFDVVLLSNIIHIYSAETNRELLEKVSRVIRPGGVVAVADFLRGRSPRAARFALVMLLRTGGGDTYAEEEVEAWLEAAGFTDPACSSIDDDRHLITAVRLGPS